MRRPMRVALLPDVHAPYHHVKNFRLALKAFKDWKPDMLFVMGDFGDWDSVSSFPKKRERRLLYREEVPLVVADLGEVDGVPTPKGKVFLMGNHEERVAAAIARHAPMFTGAVDVATDMGFPRKGWEWVDYGKEYRLGELLLTHDVGRSGVNVARQQLVDTGDNIACGHSHRLQVVYGGQAFGHVHVSASLGWLGDPDAITYKHRVMVQREFVHGVGTVLVQPDGTFFLRAHPIVKGALEIDGKVYR